MLCHRCYFRRYQRGQFVPKPAKPPKRLKPFVVDPVLHEGLVWEVALSLKNKPFVRANSRAIDLDDLVSEGRIGLLTACRNFDPDAGIKFSSYAVVCIRSTILRMLGSKVGMIRIPEYLHKALRRGTDGSRSECLEAAKAIRARQFVHEGDTEEPLANLAHARPDDVVERSDTVAHVAKLLGTLPENEARVLRLRFGFDSESKTQAEISKSFGVSRDMIRAWETQAIKRLRRQMGVAS